jgi:hypothetical protein
VVASAFDSLALLQPLPGFAVPLNPLRGQVSFGHMADLNEDQRQWLPPFPVNGHGSFISGVPSPEGPPGWFIGPLDAVGTTAPLALLRDRVIDAWLTDSAEDLPPSLDFPARVWPLARQPVTLLAHPNHPLASETNLTLADLLRFPAPIIPAEGFPRSHAICADIGLGTLEIAKRRYDPESWEGQTADQVTLAFTTPLNARAFPSLVPLDSGPLFTNRLALVCRSDVGEHAKLQDLHCLLMARLQHLQSRHPQLRKLQLLA